MSLENIIEAIGNLSIETKTKTPIVFSLENAVESVRQTPARVIVPIQTNNEGNDIRSVTLGRVAVVPWVLGDLLLFRSVEKGTSLEWSLPEMIAYADKYVDVIRNNADLGLAGVTVEELNIEFDVFPFPDNSQNLYYGTLVTLNVKEIRQ